VEGAAISTPHACYMYEGHKSSGVIPSHCIDGVCVSCYRKRAAKTGGRQRRRREPQGTYLRRWQLETVLAALIAVSMHCQLLCVKSAVAAANIRCGLCCA
jgi:hypothetical protein